VSLKSIVRPIKDDLDEFDAHFKKLLSSDVFLVDKVVQYIVAHKGKRLRPILVLLTARLPGTPVSDRRFQAAAVMELLHTATLVHDDVVDGSDRRRGFPTINAVWQNKVSVLMGDYLFSKALLAMISLRDQRALDVISQTAERMSQGELLQVERSKDYWIEESVYFRLIADKTASLLSAACQLGILASGGHEDDLRAMAEFGENLGIAFQIRDDLLDILGIEKQTGKPIGNDIRENKITLPLLHALKVADKRQARAVIRLMKKGPTRRELAEIIDFVAAHRGIDYATEKANFYCQKALQTLERYPESEYKESLRELVTYITTRER
jgi:octaprenyl-diphosphate synthase